jgi:hypothetical protein
MSGEYERKTPEFDPGSPPEEDVEVLPEDVLERLRELENDVDAQLLKLDRGLEDVGNRLNELERRVRKLIRESLE